jgi:hypothetical protein
MYSAAMVEGVVTLYFSLFQDTAPPASKKIYPFVDFLVSEHPDKTESEYPTSSKQSDLLYTSMWSIVPFKYLSTFLAAFQCSLPRSL